MTGSLAKLSQLPLKSMLELALQLRDQAGCTGVVVDARADAESFYSRLGFTALNTLAGEPGDRPEPLPMWLPIQVIARAAHR